MRKLKTVAAISAVLSVTAVGANADEWTFATVEPGQQYFLYNQGVEGYLNDDNSITPYAATLWRVNADGSVVSTSGRYINVTESHVDTKTLGVTTAREYSFTATAACADSVAMSAITPFPAEGPVCYALGNLVEDSWSRGVILPKIESHVHYITVNPDSTLCADSTAVTTAFGQWLFVSKGDYESASQARGQALQRLDAAIAQSQAIHDNTLSTTTLKTALGAQLVSAKALYKTASSALLGRTVKYDKIVSATESLLSAAEAMTALSDYYVASLKGVENVELLSGGIALRALTTTAKGSVEAAVSKEAMRLAMTTLRLATLGYIKTVETFAEGQEFTGLIANASFDLGDMTGWNSLSNDDFAAGTAPVKGELEGSDGRYYLNNETTGALGTSTGQFIFQPVIGLPAGDYKATIMMSAPKGTLRQNSAHVIALVAPSSLFSLTDSVTAAMVISKIGDLIKDGELKSGSVKTDDTDVLEEAAVEFSINDGDVLVLGLNAGLIPITGTIPYKADEMRLFYLRPPVEESGVTAVTDDAEGEEAYFNLHGLRVDQPQPGQLLIKRQGGRAIKVVVK